MRIVASLIFIPQLYFELTRSRHSGTNLSSASDLAILHESRPFLPDAFMHRYGTPSLGYGLGKVAESWYSTGIPPTTPKQIEAVIASRHWIGRIA